MATHFRTRSASVNTKPTTHATDPERHKSKSNACIIKVKVAGFKPHPNPYGDDHGQQYSFKLLANGELSKALSKGFPNDKFPGEGFLNEWMKVNPREQNLTGPIMKSIADTWDELPQEFFRVNRGIVITADSVSFDNESGTAVIVLSDPKKHGIVDGAHTFRKIVEHLIPATYAPPGEEGEVAEQPDSEDTSELEGDKEEPQAEPNRYLSCEVWTGLNLAQLALLTAGRNTSRSVPPYAIMEMKGNFDPLRDAIVDKNPDYGMNCVAFKPNEHVEGLPEFKPVSVLEVLQLMVAMDITHSDANNHPIQAYKNRGLAPKFFTERMDEYTKMLPLIGDFLLLFDMLRQSVPEAYDAAKSSPRRWTKVLAGQGQKVDRGLYEPLYYLDPSGETKAMKSPSALFFPIFSAFRAGLKEVGGKYRWCDGKSPTEWPAEEFHAACQRLALKVAKAARNKDSLHAVGRDHEVWATCYETLNSFLFENGRKKKA
jgi:hypothetical protein